MTARERQRRAEMGAIGHLLGPELTATQWLRAYQVLSRGQRRHYRSYLFRCDPGPRQRVEVEGADGTRVKKMRTLYGARMAVVCAPHGGVCLQRRDASGQWQGGVA